MINNLSTEELKKELNELKVSELKKLIVMCESMLENSNSQAKPKAKELSMQKRMDKKMENIARQLQLYELKKLMRYNKDGEDIKVKKDLEPITINLELNDGFIHKGMLQDCEYGTLIFRNQVQPVLRRFPTKKCVVVFPSEVKKFALPFSTGFFSKLDEEINDRKDNSVNFVTIQGSGELTEQIQKLIDQKILF